MTPADARNFLRRLVREEDFRKQLEDDPSDVLAEFGVEVSLTAFSRWARMPSLDEIRAVAAVVEPNLDLDNLPEEEELRPMGPSFGTCLWMALSLTVATRAAQAETAQDAT
jgi:hypothetical protein